MQRRPEGARAAPGRAADRVAVIRYGADPRAFQPDPRPARWYEPSWALPADTPLIVTVSRLVYKKGLTYLLEAFPRILARHPNAVLVIAGYGDLREELERRADELGIGANVRFPGQLDRDRAARYVSAADVYVVPSIRDQGGNIDGLPNALLEGMGAARPIVASRRRRHPRSDHRWSARPAHARARPRRARVRDRPPARRPRAGDAARRCGAAARAGRADLGRDGRAFRGGLLPGDARTIRRAA